MMNKQELRQAADAAEARQARQAIGATTVTEEDLADVIDVDAVDEYVEATGEYPMSGDLAEGDVVEDGIIPDLVGGDPTLGGLGADIDAMPGKKSDGRAKGKAPRAVRE
jgi:hypothetical protein